MATVTVIGATSWGTTLGIVIARNGHDVWLLARTHDEAEALEAARENTRFVPGFPFPESMHATARHEDAFRSTDLILFAVPSQTLRSNAASVSESVPRRGVVVSAVKGLELSTGRRMSEVLADELAQRRPRLCALSGPNLANEIVRGMPASAVVAAEEEDTAATAQQIINSQLFRVYTNDDVIGVELAGALKNIIALGAGICDGVGYGDNTKATFMTRGLAEIARLGVAAGARPSTFSGLAGMGDLIATCSSTLSRNHYVGSQLAAGRTLAEIRTEMHNVAEGVDTTRAALEFADKLDVEMPIAQATARVMFGEVSVHQAVRDLMGREPRAE